MLRDFNDEPTIVEKIRPCARCWLQPEVHDQAHGWVVICNTCKTDVAVGKDRAVAIGEWNGLMSALNEAVIVSGTIDNE